MKVNVDKAEGFTCRPAGKVGFNGGSLMYDNRGAVDRVRGRRRAIGVSGGYPGVDESDDTTSC